MVYKDKDPTNHVLWTFLWFNAVILLLQLRHGGWAQSQICNLR